MNQQGEGPEGLPVETVKEDHPELPPEGLFDLSGRLVECSVAFHRLDADWAAVLAGLPAFDDRTTCSAVVDGQPATLAVTKTATDRLFVQVFQTKSGARSGEEDDRNALALKIMKIGTWNWERDTNEMLHDATSVALFGYEDGDYPFRTFQEHLTRHDADTLDQPTIEALAEFPSTQPVQEDDFRMFVRRIPRADGSRIWARIAELTVPHPVRPHAMRTIGTFQDISQEVEAYLSLRKAQKDLAHTEGFINASTTAAEIGLWTVVPATGETWFSPSFFGLVGHDEARLKASFDEFLSLIHEDDRQAVADAYREVCEGRSALFRVDFRMRRSDGAFTWFGASARLIEIEGPNGYTLLCGAQIVITDRKEALARVEESSRATEEAMHRLERLAENVPGGIYEIRRPPDGPLTVSFFSPTLAELHGVEADDLTTDARAFFRHVLPEDRPKVDEAAKISAKTLQAYKVRYRVQHPTCGLRWIEAFSRPTREDDGTLVWHGSTFDVTDDVARQEALDKARAESAYAARHDPLTGLPNRRYFDEKMSELTGSDAAITVVRIDLDHFKLLNDTLGHAAGDAVLAHFAGILSDLTGEMGFAARMGGDEFIIVLHGDASEDSAFALVDRIRDAMSEPFEYDGKPCKYDATFGIASRRGRSVEDLLGFADAALYDAKATARGRQRVFDIAFEFAHASKRRRTDELKRAIENREFEPFFHPQVSAATGQVTGFEVLARWRHPGDGLLPPAAFLEAADHLHVVQDIDRIIFERAQESLCRFRQKGIYIPKLAFNLSPKRIGDPDFARSVRSLNFGGTAISFELLESVLLDDECPAFDHSIDLLREAGFRIEVDDFGSGHSSIIGVLRVRPDAMKIDMRLVSPITHDQRARTLLRAILEIAASMDIEIIAEGVETMEHAALLKGMGCDLLQGYAFAKPMDEETTVQFLRSEPMFTIGPEFVVPLGA